jgi:hypothetical protein
MTMLAEQRHKGGVAIRFIVITTTAFLTLVYLFAAQAILPFLAVAYKVSSAAMSFAVNASTIGMAASGVYLASYFSGGLVGSIVLGQPFDLVGWTACVAGIGCILLIACALTIRLRAAMPRASLANAT